MILKFFFFFFRLKVLGNVKFKIDSCAKTYNNFSLLYFKAKLNLIKRLSDSKPKLSYGSSPSDKVIFHN